MAIVLAMLCFFLYTRGYKKQFDIVVFSTCVSLFITYSLKYLLQVPRPITALVFEHDGRFPSGHATMAAVVMSIGVYAGLHIKHRLARVIVYALSVAWFVLVAYSRIYLQVHVFVDVVVGGLIGVGATYFVVLMFKHLRYYR
jgi:undecaprenyl-diphosphatase